MSSTTSLPLSSIIAQPDTFQMRDNAYSQETVDKIVAGFDPRLLDPLQVFKNASGQYVIAGDSHSRFEALKRLAASGGAPGIDLSAVPVNIVDESTAHTLALRGNTKSTAYKPMELAKVFGEEQKRDSSLTVRDIARIHSKTVSSVNQHLALNALPAAAQDAVRMNTLSPEVGGVFGSFIQNNSIAKEDATAIYERFVKPNDFTKNGLDTALQTLLKIPKTEQMGLGGMFGDESGGGENYGQALTDIAVKKQELDIKKRALASISSAVKKVPGSSAVDQPKLQEEIDAANAEIVNLQESLGAGVSPSAIASSSLHTKEQVKKAKSGSKESPPPRTVAEMAKTFTPRNPSPPAGEVHGPPLPAVEPVAEVIAPAPSVPVAMTAQAEKSRRKTRSTFQTQRENAKTQARFAKKFERDAQTEAARTQKEMDAQVASDAASAETERKAFLATPEGSSLASAEAKRERKRLRNGVSEPAVPTASAPAVDMDSMDRAQERLDAMVNAEAPAGGGGNPPNTPPGGGGGGGNPPGGPPEDPRWAELLARRKQNRATAALNQEKLRTKTQSRSAVDGRAELHAAQKAAHRLGAVSTEDYVEFLNNKVHDQFLLPRERMGAQAELAGIEAARQKADAKQNADVPNTEVFGPVAPADALKSRREELAREQYNRHAADPKLRPKMGGQKYQDELRRTYKRENVANDSDHKGLAGSFGGAIAGYRFVRALEQSIGTGGQIGSAVGSLVKGIAAAVVGASSALLDVGETILGLLLSPFGKSGAAIGKAVDSLGKLMTSALSSGGAIAGAVAHFGAAYLGAGIALEGAAVGAAIGGAIGLAGGPAGGLAGAGIGAMIAGTIGQALGQIASQFGGMVGSVLGAVGTAVGEVGKMVSSTLNAINDLLSDLINTGSRFAKAASANSIAGGLSLQAGSASSTLSRVLTGDPNGMASFYSNWSNMSPWLAQKQSIFGVRGVNPQDPASMLLPGYERFQDNGRRFKGPEAFIQQRVAMEQLYGPVAPQMAQLFQSGLPVVQELVKVIRENTMSAKDTQSNGILNLQLEGLGMQADALKMKLLGAFMPLIENVLPMIKSGMETFSRFLSNQFPVYLHIAMDMLGEFGQMLANGLPKVFKFIEQMLVSTVQITQKIAGSIAHGPVGWMLGSDGQKALSDFAVMPLSQLGLATKDGDKQYELSRHRQSQMVDAQATVAALSFADKIDLSKLNPAKPEYADAVRKKAALADARATQARLQKEANDAESKAIDDLPSTKAVKAFGEAARKPLADLTDSLRSTTDAAFGLTKQQIALADKSRALQLEAKKQNDLANSLGDSPENAAKKQAALAARDKANRDADAARDAAVASYSSGHRRHGSGPVAANGGASDSGHTADDNRALALAASLGIPLKQAEAMLIGLHKHDRSVHAHGTQIHFTHDLKLTTVENPDSLYKHKVEIMTEMARSQIRALQHAN